MQGEKDLQKLLKTMSPELSAEDYVFCSLPGDYGDFLQLVPIASFKEQEGLTLIVTKTAANNAGLAIEQCFRMITLKVHSSLEAVGLTSAVSTKLAEHGISANVVAAYYHDHIFVQSSQANEALQALKDLSDE